MSDDQYQTGLVRDLPPVGIRIAPDLKERIKRAASENSRSMSAEIVHTLERAYPPPGTIEAVRQNMHRIVEKIARATTDDDRRDLLNSLEAIERDLNAAYEEEIALTEAKLRDLRVSKPVTDKDIPF